MNPITFRHYSNVVRFQQFLDFCFLNLLSRSLCKQKRLSCFEYFRVLHPVSTNFLTGPMLSFWKINISECPTPNAKKQNNLNSFVSHSKTAKWRISRRPKITSPPITLRRANRTQRMAGIQVRFCCSKFEKMPTGFN